MAYYNNNEHGFIEGGRTAVDNIDPLLVNLHDTLTEYSRDNNKTNFNGLMDAVASILDARLTDKERVLASEVLINLIEQAASDIRRNLSEKLAVRDDLHESLLHYLAYGHIDLADPVLRYSSLLTDTDLMYVIQSKGRAHWCAIAARENLSPTIATTLIRKKDADTIMAVLKNEGISLAPDILHEIIPVAKHNRHVAETMADYKGLPKDLAIKLYWYVSVALRDNLVSKFTLSKVEIDQSLELCMQDFVDTTIQVQDSEPTSMMIDFATYYFEQNKITERMLADVLRRRQGRFFIALFAKMTNLSHKVIAKMMQQTGGQGFAIACRALNIGKEGFISIFLLSRKLTALHKTVDSKELTMAIRYYDGLTHKMAKEILEDSIDI